MKTAFVYARFSSERQREESIDAQLRAIREYCQRENILIVQEFCDRAKSATTDRRPAFQAMIDATAMQRVDYVIVHKLDRFSRNRFDAAYYRRELKRNGVKLLSVLEHFDDTPESVILESLLDGMSEYYSRNLAREVKKGMRESALQCKHVGGRPPYGFTLNPDRTYRIDPETADNVRMMFRMYADGKSYADILRALEGQRTGSGAFFGKNSISEILRNEKYRGVYVFNRAAEKDADGRRNNHASKDPADVIRIENGCPRLVSDETWNAVQKRLHDNTRNAAGTAKHVYLLSGLLYCGKCGAPMHGATCKAGRNRTEYSYYACTARSRTRRCDMPRFSARVLEDAVLDAVERLLHVTDEEIAYIYELVKNVLPDQTAQIRKLQRKRDDLQRRLRNLVRVASESPTPTIGAEIRAIETQIQSLSAQIANTPRRTDLPTLRDVTAFCRQKLDIRKKEPTEQKILLRRLIEKIIVHPNDDLEIAFKLAVVNTNGGGVLSVLLFTNDRPARLRHAPGSAAKSGFRLYVEPVR